MKIFNVLLFISLSLFSCTKQIITPQSSAVAGSANSDIIEWSEARKLVWQDFTGSLPASNNEHAAVTTCGFSYSTDKVKVLDKPHIKVINLFFRQLSWVKPSQVNRPELLEHEQLHFDISELYARKLRKEFASSSISYFNLKKKTESIYKRVHTQYMLRQEEYENASNYSLNMPNQTEWVRKIKQELDLLKNYSN